MASGHIPIPRILLFNTISLRFLLLRQVSKNLVHCNDGTRSPTPRPTPSAMFLSSVLTPPEPLPTLLLLPPLLFPVPQLVTQSLLSCLGAIDELKAAVFSKFKDRLVLPAMYIISF